MKSLYLKNEYFHQYFLYIYFETLSIKVAEQKPTIMYHFLIFTENLLKLTDGRFLFSIYICVYTPVTLTRGLQFFMF